MNSFAEKRYPVHPGLGDLVETLLDKCDEDTGAWRYRFDVPLLRLSGTTTAEVCTSLLSIRDYVSDDLRKQIDQRTCQAMKWLLRITGERNPQDSQLHNFVRPLEAYASYVLDSTGFCGVCVVLSGRRQSSCFRANCHGIGTG